MLTRLDLGSNWEEEVSALVFDFGSYTSRIGHSGDDCPRVTFPTWVGHQDKTVVPSADTPEPQSDEVHGDTGGAAGGRFKRKKPYRIGETEISFWQEGLDLRNPMKECLGLLMKTLVFRIN